MKFIVFNRTTGLYFVSYSAGARKKKCGHCQHWSSTRSRAMRFDTQRKALNAAKKLNKITAGADAAAIVFTQKKRDKRWSFRVVYSVKLGVRPVRRATGMTIAVREREDAREYMRICIHDLQRAYHGVRIHERGTYKVAA